MERNEKIYATGLLLTKAVSAIIGLIVFAAFLAAILPSEALAGR